MSPTADDKIEVREWDLEDIERELFSIHEESMRLPPDVTAERIQGCTDAALKALQKLLGRE